MTTMTREERTALAVGMLDRWLEDHSQMESSIERALEDLGSEIEELQYWQSDKDRWCHHKVAGAHQCKKCLTATIKALGERYESLWKLWEARA